MTLFILILSVWFCSGFLSLAEASIVSMSEMKAFALLNNSRSKATEALYKIVKDKDRYLSTIIILNTGVNVIGSIMIGIISAETLNNDFWETVLTIVFTLIVLYGAEMIPKLYASNNYVTVAKFVSGPLLLLSWIITPLLMFSAKVCKPFITKASEKIELGDLKHFIRSANDMGIISETTNSIIDNSFELVNKTAKDIMTCYSSIETISDKELVIDNKNKILKAVHSRLIVVNSEGEHVGTVCKNDLLVAIAKSDDTVKIEDLMNPIIIDKLDTPLIKIMEDTKRSPDNLVLIKDNNDKAVGVLSSEDIYRFIAVGSKEENKKTVFVLS